MMFKVISMHSKPCKHAKYNEILRNTQKKTMLSNNIGVFDFCPTNIFAPKLMICMNFVLDVPDSKQNSKPLNII